MSDHDYEKMTKELGMNIQLKKITGSEAGSDIDALSENGENRQKSVIRSNPATLEYFTSETQVLTKRKTEHHIRNKRSADFKFSSMQEVLSRSNYSANNPMSPPENLEPHSPISFLEVDIAKQNQEDKNDELQKLKMQNSLLVISKMFSKHSTKAT